MLIHNLKMQLTTIIFNPIDLRTISNLVKHSLQRILSTLFSTLTLLSIVSCSLLPNSENKTSQVSTVNVSGLPQSPLPSSYKEAQEATKDAPQSLGVYSPFGTSTSMTSNNTSTQSTQNTPMLATPFLMLKSAPIDTSPKNAIPYEVSKLMKEKKLDEALKEIDREVKKNPRNVQLQFIRTRILVEQGQYEQARRTLQALIEKYPDLPEPYNNLAVLYASAGKLDLARENLETCLKLAPNYSIALQNLADVYTRTAATYYGRAYSTNRKLVDAERKRKLAEEITK